MIWRLLCILIISTSSRFSAAESTTSIVLKSEYLYKEQAYLAANRLFWQAISEGLVDGQAIIRYLNKGENYKKLSWDKKLIKYVSKLPIKQQANIYQHVSLLYKKDKQFIKAKAWLSKSQHMIPLEYKKYQLTALHKKVIKQSHKSNLAGEDFYQNKQYYHAIDQFKIAHEAVPNNVRYVANLVLAYYKYDSLIAASNIAKAFLKINKNENNNHAVHYNLSLVYTKQAKFGLAKQHLEKSLILKPHAFKQKKLQLIIDSQAKHQAQKLKIKTAFNNKKFEQITRYFKALNNRVDQADQVFMDFAMETLAQSSDDIKTAFTFHLIDNLATGYGQDISDIFTLIGKPAVPALIDAYWYENKLYKGILLNSLYALDGASPDFLAILKNAIQTDNDMKSTALQFIEKNKISDPELITELIKLSFSNNRTIDLNYSHTLMVLEKTTKQIRDAQNEAIITLKHYIEGFEETNNINEKYQQEADVASLFKQAINLSPKSNFLLPKLIPLLSVFEFDMSKEFEHIPFEKFDASAAEYFLKGLDNHNINIALNSMLLLGSFESMKSHPKRDIVYNKFMQQYHVKTTAIEDFFSKGHSKQQITSPEKLSVNLQGLLKQLQVGTIKIDEKHKLIYQILSENKEYSEKQELWIWSLIDDKYYAIFSDNAGIIGNGGQVLGYYEELTPFKIQDKLFLYLPYITSGSGSIEENKLLFISKTGKVYPANIIAPEKIHPGTKLEHYRWVTNTYENGHMKFKFWVSLPNDGNCCPSGGTYTGNYRLEGKAPDALKLVPENFTYHKEKNN
jgi:hypothetical protein